MKKYSVHFIFLILAAGLIILGACGSGSIVDLSDKNSDEYRKIDEARYNLTDEGGLIEHCGAGKISEYCEQFKTYSSEKEESSSSEEESSSSSEGDASSSSEEEPSSSAAASSSSSLPAGSYDIPQFTCSWSPSPVEPGSNVQLKIEFNSPNSAADADCNKKAWLGVNKPNTLGGLSDKYDTSYFELNKDYRTSGSVLGTTVQWPANGIFKGDLPIDEITASKNAAKIIGSTVTCENASQNKFRNSRNQDCNPLQIGFPPSSSSIAPSSSSAAPSSSSVAPSSSSRLSSSSVAPSSSSSRSSSSLAPSSSSSSAGGGGGGKKYCDWGVCVNGNGWGCDDGGCYMIDNPDDDNPITEARCEKDYGKVVSCCASNHRPPSANYPSCN